MKPVPQTGDSTGGPERPLQKPMDKPEHQYIANDYDPPDDCHAEPMELPEQDGSYSKKFGFRPAPRG